MTKKHPDCPHCKCPKEITIPEDYDGWSNNLPSTLTQALVDRWVKYKDTIRAADDTVVDFNRVVMKSNPLKRCYDLFYREDKRSPAKDRYLFSISPTEMRWFKGVTYEKGWKPGMKRFICESEDITIPLCKGRIDSNIYASLITWALA